MEERWLAARKEISDVTCMGRVSEQAPRTVNLCDSQDPGKKHPCLKNAVQVGQQRHWLNDRLDIQKETTPTALGQPKE